MDFDFDVDLPFTVDTWTKHSQRRPFHFLTHAHADHTSGICSYASPTIYCSSLTRRILFLRYPSLDERMFVDLEVGQSIVIRDRNDSSTFTVSAFDANHCPGSIMLLFEGEFGNILHTGDCRLTVECIAQLPPQFIAKKGSFQRDYLDCIFLDCTFGKESLKMPSKSSAIRQVIDCIWKHPDASLIYLACDLLGQEEILTEICKTFGSKIYVDKSRLAEYHAILSAVEPNLLSEDPACRFHVCEGFPRLYDKAKAKFAEAEMRGQSKPLFIRPSTQWYACEERDEGAGSALITTARRLKYSAPKAAEKDQFGVWHVCYSMHSSQAELEEAIALLCPRLVISTTPTCRASELPFVRNIVNHAKNIRNDKFVSHCSYLKALSQTTLLTSKTKHDVGQSSNSNDVESKDSFRKKKGKDVCSTITEECSQIGIQSSSPKKPIPLFGRARHNLPLSPPLFLMNDEETSETSSSDCSPTSSDSAQDSSASSHKPNKISMSSLNKCSQKDLIMGHSLLERRQLMEENSSVEDTIELNLVEDDSIQNKETSKSTPMDASIKKRHSCEEQEKPRILHDSVRRLYRSLHVPIPQPLPSLLDLHKISKRPKYRFR